MSEAAHLLRMELIRNKDKLLNELEITYNNRIQQLIIQKMEIQREIHRQCNNQFACSHRTLTQNTRYSVSTPNDGITSPSSDTIITTNDRPKVIKVECIEIEVSDSTMSSSSIIDQSLSSRPKPSKRFRFNNKTPPNCDGNSPSNCVLKKEYDSDQVLAPIDNSNSNPNTDGINESPSPQCAFSAITNITECNNPSSDDCHQVIESIQTNDDSMISIDQPNSTTLPYSSLLLLCSYCPYSVGNKALMDAHESAHHAERPLICPHCSKRFRSRSNLKNHIRVHTGERPFKCKYCTKAFSTKSTLTNHERIHTGERPFHCMQCGKNFSQSGQLKKHKCTRKGNTVLTPKKESEEGVSLTGSTPQSTSGMSVVSPVTLTPNGEQWKCQQCPLVFPSGRSLAGHMNAHRSGLRGKKATTRTLL